MYLHIIAMQYFYSSVSSRSAAALLPSVSSNALARVPDRYLVAKRRERKALVYVLMFVPGFVLSSLLTLYIISESLKPIL